MAKEIMRLEGFAELETALSQLSTRVSRTVQRNALGVAAEPMRRRMGELAPMGDPEQPTLKMEMVISNASGEDAQEVAIAIGPSREAFYGSFVEFGTAHQPAQPFVRPAFDEHVEEAAQAIADELRNELDFL